MNKEEFDKNFKENCLSFEKMKKEDNLKYNDKLKYILENFSFLLSEIEKSDELKTENELRKRLTMTYLGFCYFYRGSSDSIKEDKSHIQYVKKAKSFLEEVDALEVKYERDKIGKPIYLKIWSEINAWLSTHDI